MDDRLLGSEAIAMVPRQTDVTLASPACIPADLFPLPLTPLEQYLLLDDLPAQPMTAFVQLTFASELDRDRLEAALHHAVHRNPLLASRIRTHTKVWHWEYDAAFQPKLECFAQQPPTKCGRIVPMDLRQHPGMRVWFHRHTEDRWRLLFQFHHACADGIGMRRFVLDALAHYANTTAAHKDAAVQHVRFERLDHLRLRQRGCVKHLTDTAPVVRLTGWQKAKNSYYFFFQPPAPLLGARREPVVMPATTPGEPVLSKIIDLDESKALCRWAKQREAGLNEIGLALLFRQCRQWQVEHGLGNPSVGFDY